MKLQLNLRCLGILSVHSIQNLHSLHVKVTSGDCHAASEVLAIMAQGRRRRTKSGPVVDNGGRVGVAAPGRVGMREGATPPAQLGGMGERCKLPHRGLGRSKRL